jgi:hypothetical protein
MHTNLCAIYVRPGNEYHISKEWGGCHITMAGFQTISHDIALQKIKKIAYQNFNNGHNWSPSDYSVKKSKNGWTMEIKSQTLGKIVHELKESHFQKLKGPEEANVAFHVTLPNNIKNINVAEQYAKSLVCREWFLTVAEKTGDKECKWHNHTISIKK